MNTENAPDSRPGEPSATTTADTQEPLKPRPRPANREVDKQAQALAEKHVLPAPPAKVMQWDEMQSYLALLTPEMWSHLTVYLYRLRPRIVRQLKDPNSPNYIDCISEPFTMEYVTDRHGGGKYLIEATDNSVRLLKSNSTHLFRCFFQIDEVRHEPKLNYEELDVNHRDNMSYIQLLQYRGILDAKGHPVVNSQQSNATPNNSGAGINTEVIKEILGFVSKLNTEQQAALQAKLGAPDKDTLGKSVGDILLEKMRQDDPSKQVQMLSSLLSALKEIVGTSKSDGSSALYDRIITMQSEHNKTVLQLIERITDRKNETAERERDEFDRLDKVLGFAEKLSSLRGGGGRRNGWDVGLDYAKELGVPILQTVGNLIGLRRGQPAMPIGTGPLPAPAAFDPYRDPQALRAYSSSMSGQPQPIVNPNPAPPPIGPQPAPPNIPPSSPAPPPPVAPNGNGQLAGLLQQYGNLIIGALNSNTSGVDFADHVTGLFGLGIHALISSQGEPALVQAMMNMPEIALFGENRVRTFVREFVDFERILKEENEEE